MLVRKSVALPQVGQNFLLESLQSLRRWFCQSYNSTSIARRLLETSVTPQNPRLDGGYPPTLDIEQIQPKVQQHVLHRIIGRHTAHWYCEWCCIGVVWDEIEAASFVTPNVVGRDPLALAVVRFLLVVFRLGFRHLLDFNFRFCALSCII